MPFHLTGSLQRSVDWDAQCAVSVSFTRRAKHRTCGAHSSAARAWHRCNPSPHLLLPDSTFNVNRLSSSTLPPLIHRSHEPTLLYLQVELLVVTGGQPWSPSASSFPVPKSLCHVEYTAGRRSAMECSESSLRGRGLPPSHPWKRAPARPRLPRFRILPLFLVPRPNRASGGIPCSIHQETLTTWKRRSKRRALSPFWLDVAKRFWNRKCSSVDKNFCVAGDI